MVGAGAGAGPGTHAGRRRLALRVAFLGTPEDAVPSLRGLLAAGHDVAVVVTRPDRRRSRGGGLSPSPVKATATEHGLRVTVDPATVLDAGVELGVVVAYGRILRPPLLGQVPLVNLHFSLLPRWRGAAPVERAILAGDALSGVCLMEVVDELDAGGVHCRVETRIGAEETAGELRARLADLGADLLLAGLAEGLGPAVPQAGEPSWAAKLTPAELRLDWSSPADQLARVVRVGRAWTTVGGKRLLVLAARAEVGCGPGAPGDLDGTAVVTGCGRLRLLRVAPEGRGASDAEAWLRGARGVTALGT